MPYLPRITQARLATYLSLFPVIAITGPRQAGKSTLLTHELKDYQYVTFDDVRHLDHFHEDPEGFMETYHDQVIFDEVQRVPELMLYLKRFVDEDRERYGKFVLTGSAKLLMMEKVTESLAGRIGLLSLLPLQYAELPAEACEESVIYGSYPEVVLREFVGSAEWYGAYLNTYLERDVRLLQNIGDIRDFRRLIYLLAANTSQMLNMSRFARELGVSVATVKRWLSILEATYIIFLLPPYHDHLGKRMVKSPKVYFYDTGLVAHLTGISNMELFHKGPMAGSLFENFIVADIKKREAHQGTSNELYYLRTSHGQEVDLIVDRKQTKDLIEIKHTKSFKTSMAKHLEAFCDKQDKRYFLYRGLTQPARGDLSIMNYHDYLLQSAEDTAH